MRKILILLFLSIVLSGCSKEKGKDAMEQAGEAFENLPDISTGQSEKTGEATTGEDSVGRDPKPTTIATDPGKGKSAPAITELLKEGAVTEYSGAVGEAGLHMSLSYQDGRLTGSYSYDKYGTKISLDGVLDEVYQEYLSFHLTEATDQEGQFIGIFITKDLVKGCWKSDEKLYPMYLIRTDSGLNPPKAAGKELQELEGKWYGKNRRYFSGSDLTLTALFEDLIYFELTAFNGAASGALSGFAFYGEAVAGIRYRDYIVWDDPSSQHVSFEFRKQAEELSLISNQYDYSCGMGVTFDQSYSREDRKPATPSLTELGITTTKEEEELFSQMVYYTDYFFIRNTQAVMYEDILLDGRKVRAGASYLRGAGGMCYYINGKDMMYAAIYEDGVIQYYTNDPNYMGHMPKPMQKWADGFACEVVYNEINAPYPYDSNIPELLTNQINKLRKKQAITLPEDYSLKDCIFGDLNGDDREDLAVVIEQGSGKYTGSRRIYLFLQQGGSYVLAFENNSIILGSMEGGVFGDPYVGIGFEKGKLHVMDYGGSSDRWGHIYTFTYQDGKLILTEVRVDGLNVFNLNGWSETYDLVKKRAEFRTVYESGATDSKEQNYDQLLLYEGNIQLDQALSFENAYAWCEEDLVLEPEYPMPELWGYEYGPKGDLQTRYSAEEILDKVMQKYYPKLKKTPLPCSREILDNYSRLLGYQVATYYYSDGEHQLYYYDRSLVEDTKRMLHSVYYKSRKSENWDSNHFYQIWDDTGEEGVN